MDITVLKDKISFSKDGPKKELLYDSEKTKAVLFCLEPGQSVGPHAVSSEIAMFAIDGKGIIITGEGEKKAEKGSLVVCKENEQHGIRAVERFVVLAVINPRP
ncbi:MAG: cupin domain-containing protein [Deltaproteobacteria bacterium]|nr:cupin domain-containing protein [Deltaproteobacteria bacterium]